MGSMMYVRELVERVTGYIYIDLRIFLRHFTLGVATELYDNMDTMKYEICL